MYEFHMFKLQLFLQDFDQAASLPPTDTIVLKPDDVKVRRVDLMETSTVPHFFV
jgi:hypothetical protein